MRPLGRAVAGNERGRWLHSAWLMGEHEGCGHHGNPHRVPWAGIFGGMGRLAPSLCCHLVLVSLSSWPAMWEHSSGFLVGLL